MSEGLDLKYPRISFRAGGLEVELHARHGHKEGLSHTVQECLGRYFYALQQTLKSIDLSEQEWMLVRDACNGTLWERHTIPFLWGGVEDAIKLDGLDRKWEVDGAALVGKLRALTYWQSLAVVDAVERWWLEQAGRVPEPDEPED
jgi:hypothetical protein